jgi:hypothetical protein
MSNQDTENTSFSRMFAGRNKFGSGVKEGITDGAVWLV